MIVNLRGITGAGKSYVGRQLAERAIRKSYVPPGSPFNNRKTKDLLVGYELPGDLFVLGTYERVSGAYA